MMFCVVCYLGFGCVVSCLVCIDGLLVVLRYVCSLYLLWVVALLLGVCFLVVLLGMTCGLYVLCGLGFAAVWFVWGSSISLWFLVCFPDWMFGDLF